MRPKGRDTRDPDASERGSAPAEFVLVGGLLTLLTLAVLQFGLAVYVRNVVHDAAVEGAHQAALVGATAAQGIERTREVIGHAVGAEYGEHVTAAYTRVGDVPALTITVRTTLPLVGLLGAPRGMAVSASAPVETLR